MDNSDNSKNLIIAFLSGALAGGALAYLLQTEKGKALVDQAATVTKEKIEDTKAVLLETELELKKKFQDALDKVDVDGAVAKGKEIIERKLSNNG